MKQTLHLGSDFRIAQPEGVADVFNTEDAQDPAQTSIDLIRKRDYADGLKAATTALRHELTDGAIGEEDGEPEPAIRSWDDLAQRTTTLLGDVVQAQDFSPVAVRSGRSETELRLHVMKAGEEGIETAKAYLRVVSEIMAEDELENPNQEIADIARESKAFILEWAGLHAYVDRALLASLGSEPKDIKHIFEQPIIFDKKWFVKQEDGRIVLDREKIKDLSFIENKSRNPYYPKLVEKHPKDAEDGKTELYGCPARRMIAPLIEKMIQDSYTANLFGATYLSERQQQQVEPSLDLSQR